MGKCIRLPGGAWNSEFQVSRDFKFSELNGQLEMQLSESLSELPDAASQVSFVLNHVLLDEHGDTVDSRIIESGMSIGDRQFLIRELAKILGLTQYWYSVECQFCQTRFDFNLDPSQLPVKTANDEYPLAELETSIGLLTIRAPTAEDQIFISHFTDAKELPEVGALLLEKQVSRKLSERLLQTEKDVSQLTDADIALIESKAEEISPELTQIVQGQCVECHEINNVFIDPYACLPLLAESNLPVEIHQIASVYHWSEKEILMLSKKRRQHYLKLISQDAGVFGL